VIRVLLRHTVCPPCGLAEIRRAPPVCDGRGGAQGLTGAAPR